jgi:DNA-directed RNA polymerase specialized sigma24 family protein
VRDDTDIGGARGRFPTTRHSAIRDAASDDRATRDRGFAAVMEAYWKPAYKYVRLRWRVENEPAKDLTQGFFARALEKGWLAAYEPSKGSFRTFLRTCLDGFVANERKAAGRQKRDPGTPLLSLDFEGAEGELEERPIPSGKSMEDYFHEEFVRGLFGAAVAELEAECERRGKRRAFQLFDRYDLDPGPSGSPSYAALGAELGLTETEVTNQLAYARRTFRRLVLARLRRLTGSEREYRNEVRAVLGAGASRSTAS